MWETWYKMEQMIIGGIDLNPVITHHFHIDDFQKGLMPWKRETAEK